MDDRRQRLRTLLSADRAAVPSSAVSLVCARCVLELSVSGAGASVLSLVAEGDAELEGQLGHGLVHATDAISAGLEDLQLTVGEGPCLDAFGSGGPVLVPDLETETTRWPAFAPAAIELGAAAVFSFPLQIGVVQIGSLNLHRVAPGRLTQLELADALILADLATQGVVEELHGHPPEDLSWLDDPHLEIHQAAGMVQIQLGVTTEVALLRLRGYAFSHGLETAEVARQVVARSLRFGPGRERS